MLHKTLLIAGGGPRGLACAIEAIGKFSSIYIIDSAPTDSWNSLSTVANFELRSPVSFDLVTYSLTKRDWSLSTFLYKEDIFFTTQRDIEKDSRRVNRAEFYNYICWIKKKLQDNNVQFIYTNLLSIDNSTAHTQSGDIKFDYLILALGSKEKQVPSNLLKYKRIDNKDLIENEYKSLLIIGSGQGAYDIASYLYNKGVRVGLYITKDAKINQYPIPDYSLWKARTALGPYCSTLVSTVSKQRYIDSVKSWGPSITPNNQHLLLDIPIYKNINVTEIINKYDNRFVSRVGVTPINILNIKQTDINRNFRLLDTNIFVSGPLTTLYDGPRSNSIISSSKCAVQIIKEIEEVG
jgi:hypothetical protein